MENINIPPFYIGQEIVAVTTSGLWKKGDEFIVKSITKYCHDWGVNIGINTGSNTTCEVCGKDTGGSFFRVRNFAPKIQLGEFVSMKEVVQLETVCAN